MSGSGAAESTDRQAFTRLEDLVEELLDEMDDLRGRVREEEIRVRDVEALLRRFTKGDDDPASLLRRVSDLERENDSLRARIEEGRDGVDRLLARIRFLEEQR